MRERQGALLTRGSNFYRGAPRLIHRRHMEGISTEELLEVIDEMGEDDLMEACDEVGLDSGALGSEEAMRGGLRSHYGIADDVVKPRSR